MSNEKELTGLKKIFKDRFNTLYMDTSQAPPKEIPYDTLKKYLNGQRFPTLENLEIIKNNYSVSYSYLFGETKTKQNYGDDISSLGLNDNSIKKLKTLKLNADSKHNSDKFEEQYILFVIDMLINDTSLLYEMYKYLALQQGKKQLEKKHNNDKFVIRYAEDRLSLPKEDYILLTRYKLIDMLFKHMDKIIESTDIPIDIKEGTYKYAKAHIDIMNSVIYNNEKNDK